MGDDEVRNAMGEKFRDHNKKAIIDLNAGMVGDATDEQLKEMLLFAQNMWLAIKHGEGDG